MFVYVCGQGGGRENVWTRELLRSTGAIALTFAQQVAKHGHNVNHTHAPHLSGPPPSSHSIRVYTLYSLYSKVYPSRGI